jgi:hypothetical protein
MFCREGSRQRETPSFYDACRYRSPLKQPETLFLSREHGPSSHSGPSYISPKKSAESKAKSPTIVRNRLPTSLFIYYTSSLPNLAFELYPRPQSPIALAPSRKVEFDWDEFVRNVKNFCWSMTSCLYTVYIVLYVRKSINAVASYLIRTYAWKLGKHDALWLLH